MEDNEKFLFNLIFTCFFALVFGCYHLYLVYKHVSKNNFNRKRKKPLFVNSSLKKGRISHLYNYWIKWVNIKAWLDSKFFKNKFRFEDVIVFVSCILIAIFIICMMYDAIISLMESIKISTLYIVGSSPMSSI